MKLKKNLNSFFKTCKYTQCVRFHRNYIVKRLYIDI